MRKNRLLIVLFTFLTTLAVVISCTYDYFEDDTNYLLFVPEVLDNSITDCRVLVYAEDGTLVRERYAKGPSWGNDPREQVGLFGFSLNPGKYSVYCYTNSDSITFSDQRSLETAHFSLNEKEAGSYTYVQPSDILFQKLTPDIVHPSILITDTAEIKKYPGRITVRFKNFPGDASRIQDVSLRAERAATVQNLKDDTLTSRRTLDDAMLAFDKLPVQEISGTLEVDHTFLPTVDDGEMMLLDYVFLDSSGDRVIRLPLELVDRDNNDTPIRLYHGKRLIIEVDRYIITEISLVGWDEDIDSGNTDLE